MGKSLVDVSNLTIGYHNKQGKLVYVLRDVSLQIEPGETVGLVGESGSGKSTLGQAMMGYLRSGSQVIDGNVHFSGHDMFKLPRRELREIWGHEIAFIPQNAGQSLTPTMRVGQQILEAIQINMKLSGNAATNLMLDFFNQVRLPQPEVLAKRYPHELSGGQQQRVAIAMALVGNPEMLVLDEPTTGLDVTTQAHILDVLREIVAQSGTGMMYISHDMGAIAHVCDRVVVMYAGQVVEDSNAETIFKAPAHPYPRGLLESIPRLDMPGIPYSMPGSPPVPGSLKGCSFAPRCSFSTEKCHEEEPALQIIEGAEHSVRCHNWQDVTAVDFDKELQKVFHRVKHEIEEEIAITLTNVAISYHKEKFTDKLQGKTLPPDTVSDITLNVKRGETLALVGESGSGKSTIIRTISGLLPAKDGSVRFDNLNLNDLVDKRPMELRKRIQLIFQNPDASLNPRHTVSEILDQPLRLYFPDMDAKERQGRKVQLLEDVRLSVNYLMRYPGQLSGGEKQRVAIARAFAAEPEVVLCDEVTSALDVSVQAAVLDLLAELQRNYHTTYIFITHDLAVVRAFADRVAVLYQGRLCEVGTVDEIYTPPHHPYTDTLLGAILEPNPNAKPVLLAEDIPELSPPAKGCPFQRRCPLRVGDICDEETPPWQELRDADDHRIRCHIPIDELKHSNEVVPDTSN